MKIQTVELFPIALPLKAVLTLPRGASRTIAEGKQVILVKMTADDGTVGWGEAGPSRRWSAETTHSCYTSLRHYLIRAVVGRDPFDIAGLHEAMNMELAPGLDPGQPIAKAAIDLAAHDLICRKLDINLQTWLGAKARDRVELSYLVSAPDPEKTAAVVREGCALGFSGFKIKVGHNAAVDGDNVRAAIEAAEGGIVWPDANQGYTLDQALRMAKEFEALGIRVFEQPVAMTDMSGLKRLLAATAMTIVLDESAMGIPLLIELIRQEAVEGVAIKVNKVGGLHYARQMCDLARNAGLTLIGSGLMDAPIGFAASVQLFAGYGIDFPVDLNGPQHIAEDYLATSLPIQGAAALVSSEPGLGVAIDENKIKTFKLNLPAN